MKPRFRRPDSKIRFFLMLYIIAETSPDHINSNTFHLLRFKPARFKAYFFSKN